jgi:hypothetical protein
LRKKIIVPGRYIASALTWNNSVTGEKLASIAADIVGEPRVGEHWYSAYDTSLRGFAGRWKCAYRGAVRRKLSLPPSASIFAAPKVYLLP